MDYSIVYIVAFVLAGAIGLRADLRRRRLSISRGVGWSLPTVFDVVVVTATIGTAAGLLLILIPRAVGLRAIPLDSPLTWSVIATLSAMAFLWHEGTRQVQMQRPAGIVFGEWLMLSGLCLLLSSLVFRDATAWPGVPQGVAVKIFSGLAIIGGGLWLAVIVPPFVKNFEGLRIVEQVADRGEFVQTEYVSPTPECPHPERWQMLDAQTAEIEVLEFLKAIVITTKPALIVETGTFMGHSIIKMAEGLKANGFGRAITIEFDPTICAKAREHIAASGLGSWIESRNESSLDAKVDGLIDIFFSDSDTAIREAEIRRFLPQISPGGLVLVHDASSQFKVVREAAFRLEQEGLLSVVLLPTPRGLVVAQKRQDRR
jgi:predicted O-methyltransferase YrrM